MMVSRAILFSLLLFLAAAAAGAEIVPFTFCRITDTHIGNGGTNVKEDAARVADINQLVPRPDFVINTGDLVDEGTASQYRVYLDTFAPLAMPRYDVPGNHDVRWAPLGKESIQDALHIPLYRSFDHNGCHFILLDSTVTLEHWGHFDASELDWLKGDLEKTGPDIPVFIFFHHWVGRGDGMVDDEDEFLQRIAPYNVKIVFCGHGHADIQWRVNGIQFVMERGLYQGSFDTADVTGQSVTLYRHRKEDAGPTKLAVIPTPPTPAPFRLTASVNGDGKLEAEAAGGAVPAGSRWEWRADSSGRWQPMEARPNGAEASTILDRERLGSGLHSLQIRLVLPLPPDRREESHDQDGYGGDAWMVSIPLPAAQPMVAAPGGRAGSFGERWRVSGGGGIQSRLTCDNGAVYAAGIDGSLYALDPANGKPRWIFRTAGSLYCTPCGDQGTVYVGSMDHQVYALDAGTGQERWHTRVGGPVFAGVQVGDGVACVGAGDGVVYGLDARTGQQLWTYAAQGFIQQQAAFGDHAFFVGAWDNGFYAVETRTGQLRWRKHFGRSFFYSPSIGAPAVYKEWVYVPSDDDTLHAIRMKDGEVAWEVHSPDGAGAYGYSAPAITPDGKIYIAALGDRGSVMCLDAVTGNLAWRTDTGSVIYDSSCAVAGGIVTVGSVNGRFHAIDAASGKLLGSYRIGPGHLLASPAMTPDGTAAYIGSLGDSVVALSLPAPQR